jgi:hypothetical protein
MRGSKTHKRRCPTDVSQRFYSLHGTNDSVLAQPLKVTRGTTPKKSRAATTPVQTTIRGPIGAAALYLAFAIFSDARVRLSSSNA